MTCHCLISSSEDEKKSSFIVSEKRIKPHANSSHGHLFPLYVKEFSYFVGNPSFEGADEVFIYLFFFFSPPPPAPPSHSLLIAILQRALLALWLLSFLLDSISLQFSVRYWKREFWITYKWCVLVTKIVTTTSFLYLHISVDASFKLLLKFLWFTWAVFGRASFALW